MALQNLEPHRVCLACGADLIRRDVEKPSSFQKRSHCNYACSLKTYSARRAKYHTKEERRAAKKESMRKWCAANRERIREHRHKSKDKRNAKKREQYKLDPEYRASVLARSEKYQKKHPEKHIARRLTKKFGLTLEAYRRMLKEQGGGCAICGAPSSRGARYRLAVDHDHSSGVVRGLLCESCNLGLGKFLDDPDRLEAAARYLRKDR